MNWLFAAVPCWLICSGTALAVTSCTPKVCLLTNPKTYKADAFKHANTKYVSPKTGCNAASLGGYKKAIQALIDEKQVAVPANYDQFRAEMCSLKKIIVLPSYSSYPRFYSKFEDPELKHSGAGQADPPISGDKYVFLQPDTLSLSAATMLDRSLAVLKDKFGLTHSHSVKDNPAKSDASMALVVTLAHEIGHIRFHRDKKSLAVNKSCFLTDIETASWVPKSTPDPFNPNGRFRDFGDEIAGNDHTDADIPKPSQVKSTDDIAKIYDNGFASALAAASSEEDYVESFTLAVLQSYTSDDLTLNNGAAIFEHITNRPPDRTGKLIKKLDCAISPH